MIPTNPIPEVPNYGSSAIYKDLPSPEQIRAGVIPLDSLPAAWWNAMWACTNTAVNDARSAVGTLINEICNAITGAGICINESCIDQLYQAIDTIRQRIGNAVTAGAVKSSPNCGEVSIDANGIMTANGVGNAALLNTSSKVVVGAINELKTTYDCCISDLNGCISSVDNSKAPTSHVSSATTYGVGNADCYGHLKISDTYDSCVGEAADGVAASQKALYCVYCAISAAASLGNTAGCALGTAAAGTATTAARSDHVHPKPSRSDLGLGSAADYNKRAGASGVTYVEYSGANGCCLLAGDFLAYWNGAYNSSGSSNLRYYCGGAFGTAAKCAATAFAAAYNNNTACAHYSYVACRLYDDGGCATIFCRSVTNSTRPSYVWGYAAAGTTCLYNPACWSVNYATCAYATCYYTSAWCGFSVCCPGIYMCVCNKCSFPILAFVNRSASAPGVTTPVYINGNGKVCLDKQYGVPTSVSGGGALRAF